MITVVLTLLDPYMWPVTPAISHHLSENTRCGGSRSDTSTSLTTVQTPTTMRWLVPWVTASFIMTTNTASIPIFSTQQKKHMTDTTVRNISRPDSDNYSPGELCTGAYLSIRLSGRYQVLWSLLGLPFWQWTFQHGLGYQVPTVSKDRVG